MNEKITNGLIVKSIGGIYFVEAPDGVYECKARGIFRNRDISPVCGDRVEVCFENDGMGVITEIYERKNSLIRPPLANLDLLTFVTSTCEPRPNLTLLDKFIAISVYKNITPVVVFTKIDKKNSDELYQLYKNTGIKTFSVDNITGEGSAEVSELLRGKISAFTGNTGVGKSSLLNNLFPELMLATGEISKKLGRGKHTTRHVELFKLSDGTYIADTPGFSSFETQKYDIIHKEELADCFAEFGQVKEKCRFLDCSHTKEKGCAIISAVNDGKIASSRHESYVEMYEEARLIKEWELKKQ